MRLTKLLKENILVSHNGEHLVIVTDPLRSIKITDKQFRIIKGVKALITDLIKNK